MPLEHDIVEKIKKDFPPDQAFSTMELLDAAGYSGKSARCIIFLANGRLERIKSWIKSANEDSRNLDFGGGIRWNPMHAAF